MATTGLSLVKRLPRAFSLERSSHVYTLLLSNLSNLNAIVMTGDRDSGCPPKTLFGVLCDLRKDSNTKIAVNHDTR